MRRNNSKFFNFTERQWDSSKLASGSEPTQDSEIRCAVKRIFTGNLQLPKLSCRPTTQEGPKDVTQFVPASPTIKHSRSLGTLTSCISTAL
ncbi:unnamed protein product [Menidia menidia]|uniref:(Atlantic silverside) hypothetical protein n=1 Tax=Menidia menidia TaxID=238744 RepID=A0A8S4AVC9_9TELE|nr:unnamed protein product [Menidia menidia]